MDTNTPATTTTPTAKPAPAPNQFVGFPVDELEWYKRGVGIGYLALAVASFVAMAFFITHNMLGTDKPIFDRVNGLNWSIGQLIYAFISLGFAFGFNAFTWFFYQIQPNMKERVFVLVVAVAFPMFTEVGQSMTRAEQTRHESATTSETFKTMQKRVETAGTGGADTALASLVASATAEKAKAQTAFGQCSRFESEKSRQQCQRKQQQAIAQAGGKVEALQQTGEQAKSTASNQLKQDSQTLKELEGDNGYLQPIVKLLMGLGLPALIASFAIAFVIIGAIEVAMSYLGGLLRQIKEAMRLQGAEVSSPRVKARMMETSPLVSALHGAGESWAVEMGKAHTASEQLRRKVTGEQPRPTPAHTAPADTDEQRRTVTDSKPYTDGNGAGASPCKYTDGQRRFTRGETGNTDSQPDYTDNLKRYEQAKNATVGAVCGCPWCGESFTKKTYNHRFCRPAHKDDFWNAVDPARLKVKEAKARQRAKA